MPIPRLRPRKRGRAARRKNGRGSIADNSGTNGHNSTGTIPKLLVSNMIAHQTLISRISRVSMQEEQTVSFQPVSNCGPQPWYMQLFGLFILVFAVVFLVRIISLAVNLRKLRNSRAHPTPVAVVDGLWTDCYAKVHSFKEISTLPFLVSLLNFIWYTIDVFLALKVQKVTSVSYVLGRTGDGLVALALGLAFCSVLYSAAMFSEAVLRRQKTKWSALDPT